MSNWGILFSEIAYGLNEIVIVGEQLEEMRKEIQTNYFPFAMTLGTKSKSNLSLLEGRESEQGKTMIYVCRNKVCQLPADNVQEAIHQILRG